jgi:hypothetical protein
MRKRIFPLLFVSALFGIPGVSSATAQVQRTFVSGLGNDGNPCSRTAPCRTFPQAISQTNSGGEIYVLDSAGYAAFTITKPVSIVAPPGVTAGISVFFGQDGVTINAGASDTVILRGLTINNQGSGGSGIVFNTGGTLHVENCVVNGFTSGDGINFIAAAKLEVKDSIFRGNGDGIVVLPPAATAAQGVIDQVRLEENVTDGLLVSDGATVTVRNSLASGNGNTGFAAVSATSAKVELDIENCVASNNTGFGVSALSGSTGPATVRVSNSTVTHNHVGLGNFGAPAALLSRGNNTVEGNASGDTVGVGSYSAK